MCCSFSVTCIININSYTNNPNSYDDIMNHIHDLSKEEQDYQLTVEELEAFLCYLSKISKTIGNDLFNILEIAYTVGEENLKLCINAIDKLQKQKEMLENEKNID